MWSVIEIVITPQTLIFRDFLETFVTDIHAAARRVTIIRYNGKTVAYEFASGRERTVRGRAEYFDVDGITRKVSGACGLLLK